MRKSRVYLVLLHHPMYNKRMDVITTSITNLDLHDISRASRTYDLDGFLVVHPSPHQQALLNDIKTYWQEGYGGQYNPDRKEAFDLLKAFHTLEEVKEYVRNESGHYPKTVATDAHRYSARISYRYLREEILGEEGSYLLLFGTGWGIQKELVEQCDYILEPIDPGTDYNHLSVRSAVAIILDRLLGEQWYIY